MCIYVIYRSEVLLAKEGKLAPNVFPSQLFLTHRKGHHLFVSKTVRKHQNCPILSSSSLVSYHSTTFLLSFLILRRFPTLHRLNRTNVKKEERQEAEEEEKEHKHEEGVTEGGGAVFHVEGLQNQRRILGIVSM